MRWRVMSGTNTATVLTLILKSIITITNFQIWKKILVKKNNNCGLQGCISFQAKVETNLEMKIKILLKKLKTVIKKLFTKELTGTTFL